MTQRPIRVAAVGDLHCRKTSAGTIAPLLSRVNEHADMLLLCGDLTDYGTPEEAHVLAKELAVARVPMAGVLGNHDYEGGAQQEITKILTDAGVQILDGDAIEIHGIGIAGVKGFVGGFGRGTLGPWGERMIKAFVQEAIDEALKLEAALQRLRTERRIAIMHYAPVRGTVEGEPPEIFAYCGCGRLEEPLHRYPVDVVFHGHAHHGSPTARTENGIPVHNVALPLMRRLHAEHPGFHVVELEPLHEPIEEMPLVR
ncbi:metallophosphoesterase family protein [Sandaracinus amylolyticus]|nr:metallophosphoesterase [Sandaracinus amylolyticus]